MHICCLGMDCCSDTHPSRLCRFGYYKSFLPMGFEMRLDSPPLIGEDSVDKVKRSDLGGDIHNDKSCREEKSSFKSALDGTMVTLNAVLSSSYLIP